MEHSSLKGSIKFPENFPINVQRDVERLSNKIAKLEERIDSIE